MVLKFHDISKSYGKTRALQHFSVELSEGVYALLGPNGSGKTTLMNILTGNLRADAGHITFANGTNAPEDIAAMGKRFRKHLGFMPQYPGMYGNFTLEEFLWYIATLKDVGSELSERERKALIKAQIEGVLQAVELSDVSRRRISTLSGGMKQRLALAQAVLGDPKILILDEPTAGLDPKQRIAIRNYISQIALNKIVIFATHVVSDIEFIARRVIMLKKGVIIHNAAPQELIAQMTGKVWRVSVPEAEVTAFQQRFRVTSINRDEENPKNVLLRIVSDTSPNASAANVAPTLEDFYLSIYGQV